jgi:hypothetical protein
VNTPQFWLRRSIHSGTLVGRPSSITGEGRTTKRTYTNFQFVCAWRGLKQPAHVPCGSAVAALSLLPVVGN